VSDGTPSHRSSGGIYGATSALIGLSRVGVERQARGARTWISQAPMRRKPRAA
jgi:hypothetical protein